MKVKSLAVGLAASATALATIGAGTGMAATLYTNSSHTTPVAVGTTAVGTASTAISLYSGSQEVNSCSSSSLDLKLTTNSGGTVAAEITGGSFSGCLFATTVNPPWTYGLKVTGNGTTSGSNTTYKATVGGVNVTFEGGEYKGNLTTGVTAVQPTSAGAPLTLVLKSAGTLKGPLTSDGKVTGTYALTGAAAAYSLGNTPAS